MDKQSIVMMAAWQYVVRNHRVQILSCILSSLNYLIYSILLLPHFCISRSIYVGPISQELVYTFQQRYNRNLMKINEFGLILLENQYSDFAILTSKGKIIRKTIDISYRKITYLRQQNNSLQIYLQKDKFGLQIYNISKGIFEKSVTMKFSEYNQGILPICQYDNIQILDHSKESMINIFRDMKFYQQIPYAYKYYSLSDDGQYITFFSKLSYTIYFYNCFSLEFEETYETNLPIYHARRVNIRTLQIEYQSVLVIVKL
ncbi:hypothetical protein pb186bvf_016267 [Paramecium bursaria]